MIINTKFEIGDRVLYHDYEIWYIEAIEYINHSINSRGITSYYISNNNPDEEKQWIDENELIRINTRYTLGDTVYYIDNDNNIKELTITNIMYHILPNDSYIIYDTALKSNKNFFNTIKENKLYSSIQEINDYISKTTNNTKIHYIIINISNEYPEIVIDENGYPLIFETRETAEKVANEYQSCKIIQI